MIVVTNKKIRIELEYQIIQKNFNYNNIIEFIDKYYSSGHFLLKNNLGHIYAIGDFISIEIPIKPKNIELISKKISIGINGIIKSDDILIEDEHTNFFYKDLFYYIDSKMNLCIFKNNAINFEIKGRTE